MAGIVEIVTGRERRRRWSTEDKLRLVAETYEPGTAVRAVAARHDVCESLLFTWRRQVRDGVLSAASAPVFVPVHMIGAPPASRTEPSTPAPVAGSAPSGLGRPMAAAGLIEIDLGRGRQVRVGRDVNLAALRRVLAALGQ